MMKKMKFKSSEEKQRYLQLEKQWELLKKRHGVTDNKKNKVETLSYSLSAPAGRMTSHHIPSRDTGWLPCVRPEDKIYTGSKMIGVGVMHKSNAVPIFNDNEAKEISSMRR